jgi:hypothetical protein
VAASPARRAQLLELNPVLQGLMAVDRTSRCALVASNARVVRRQYSLAAIGRRLRDVYAAVQQSPPSDAHELAGGSRLLDAFLHLARFHPIRVD